MAARVEEILRQKAGFEHPCPVLRAQLLSEILNLLAKYLVREYLMLPRVSLALVDVLAQEGGSVEAGRYLLATEPNDLALGAKHGVRRVR